MPEKPSQKTQNSFERALRPQSRVIGKFPYLKGWSKSSLPKFPFQGTPAQM
jgi:hypothetical protein